MDNNRRGVKQLVPHLSWSGPQPSSEVDSYALAITLRLVGSGLLTHEERPSTIPPTSLTVENMPRVSKMYAYCHTMIRDEGIRTSKDLILRLRNIDENEVARWVTANKRIIASVESELIDYVETGSNAGFRCYG